MNPYGPEYESWLAGLKVGDKIAVTRSHFGDTTYTIHTIERITKTRQIKVSGYDTKYKNSHEMGNNISWSVNRYLEPVTNGILEGIERDKILTLIEAKNFKTLSIEKLRQIKRIIEEGN